MLENLGSLISSFRGIIVLVILSFVTPLLLPIHIDKGGKLAFKLGWCDVCPKTLSHPQFFKSPPWATLRGVVAWKLRNLFLIVYFTKAVQGETHISLPESFMSGRRLSVPRRHVHHTIPRRVLECNSYFALTLFGDSSPFWMYLYIKVTICQSMLQRSSPNHWNLHYIIHSSFRCD